MSPPQRSQAYSRFEQGEAHDLFLRAVSGQFAAKRPSPATLMRCISEVTIGAAGRRALTLKAQREEE